MGAKYILLLHKKNNNIYTAAVDGRMTWLRNKLTLFPLSVNDFEHCSSYFLRGEGGVGKGGISRLSPWVISIVFNPFHPLAQHWMWCSSLNCWSHKAVKLSCTILDRATSFIVGVRRVIVIIIDCGSFFIIPSVMLRPWRLKTVCSTFWELFYCDDRGVTQDDSYRIIQ